MANELSVEIQSALKARDRARSRNAVLIVLGLVAFGAALAGFSVLASL